MSFEEEEDNCVNFNQVIKRMQEDLISAENMAKIDQENENKELNKELNLLKEDVEKIKQTTKERYERLDKMVITLDEFSKKVDNLIKK